MLIFLAELFAAAASQKWHYALYQRCFADIRGKAFVKGCLDTEDKSVSNTLFQNYSISLIGTMALASKGGVCTRSGLRGLRVAPVQGLRRSFAPFASPSISQNVRLVRKVAAVEEQQTAAEEQPQEPIVPVSTDEMDNAELAELDAAQEDLLKWMLYVPEDAQDSDLDEMVDYDEFADDEYEEVWEEVEGMLEECEYEFKIGDKVMGTIYECDEDGAYVEIGAKTAGFVPLAECSLAKLKTVRPLFFVHIPLSLHFVATSDPFPPSVLAAPRSPKARHA